MFGAPPGADAARLHGAPLTDPLGV
jgi:hypothetical protein